MFDPEIACRQWLSLSSALLDLVPATQIVGGDLPEGANPGRGENWITFRMRSGQRHAEIPEWIDVSFEITVWGKKNSDVDIRQIALVISDLVYSTLNVTVAEAEIVAAAEEVAPQSVSDPVTGWAMCVYHCLLSMRYGSGSFSAAIPGIPSSGRHAPVEACDGILKSFTLEGLPDDPAHYMVVFNGIVTNTGFTQSGDVITFDTAPTELFVYF